MKIMKVKYLHVLIILFMFSATLCAENTIAISKIASYTGSTSIISEHFIPEGKGMITCHVKQKLFEKTMLISGLFQTNNVNSGSATDVKIQFVEDGWSLVAKKITYNIYDHYCLIETNDTISLQSSDIFKIYTKDPFYILLIGNNKFSRGSAKPCGGYFLSDSKIEVVKGDRTKKQAKYNILCNTSYRNKETRSEWIECVPDFIPYSYRNGQIKSYFPSYIIRLLGSKYQEQYAQRVKINNPKILYHISPSYDDYNTKSLYTSRFKNITTHFSKMFEANYMSCDIYYPTGSYKCLNGRYPMGDLARYDKFMYVVDKDTIIANSSYIEYYRYTRSDGIIVRSTKCEKKKSYYTYPEITEVEIIYPDSSRYIGTLENNMPSYDKPLQLVDGVMYYKDGTSERCTYGKTETQLRKEKEERERKQEEWRIEHEKQEKIRLNNLIKKYGKEYGTAIFNHQIIIGMPEKLVIESWGDPDYVHTYSSRYSSSEQWVYESEFDDVVYYTAYLYFEDGVLTAIQD